MKVKGCVSAGNVQPGLVWGNGMDVRRTTPIAAMARKAWRGLTTCIVATAKPTR